MTSRQLAAKEYMDGYGDACRRVRQCEEQYERESLLIDAIRSASDNDGMPHGTNIGRPTEAKAIRLADKGLSLFDAKREALRIQGEIFAVAFLVGGVESDVLIERYVKLKDWNDVYTAVNYSETQTLRYHRSGLDKVADILNL